MVTREDICKTIGGRGQRLLDLGFVHVIELDHSLFRDEDGFIDPKIVRAVELETGDLVSGKSMAQETVDKISANELLTVDVAQSYKWVLLANWFAFRSKEDAMTCMNHFGRSANYFDLS